MTKSRWLGLVVAVCAFLLLSEGVARAQSPSDPNSGSLKFSAGFDVASVYVFRGFVQETDPKFTAFPYGDLGVVLTSGDGTIKSTVVNIGVWNSLNTGSSGSDGPSGELHYEGDFYARVNFLFGSEIAVGAGYMALTSPNNMFNTIEEFNLKVSKGGWLSPYAFLASELNDTGQADNGRGKGTYLELGAVPTFPVGMRARLSIPAKAGFSLNDYYELAGTDHKFGYFNVGAMLTLPLSKAPTRFGSWNVHGGAEVYVLGDATKPANNGKSSKPVGFVGIGFTY